MSTVKLTRVSDSVETDVNLKDLLYAISKKKANSVDDVIVINDVAYTFSSVKISSSGIAPAVNDARTKKIGDTIYLQYWDGSTWVSSGTSWSI